MILFCGLKMFAERVLRPNLQIFLTEPLPQSLYSPLIGVNRKLNHENTYYTKQAASAWQNFCHNSKLSPHVCICTKNRVEMLTKRKR